MIDWIGATLAVYGPWLVGGMAMMETALLLGLILPAEPTIIVATAFALEGHFSFGSVVVAAVVGAALGDSVGFFVGRWGGRRVLRGKGRLARSARRQQDRASVLFDRHPIFAVTLARAIPFVRTLMPPVAGSTALTYRRFLVFDLLGVTAWAVVGLGIAYTGARGWQLGVASVGFEGALLVGAAFLMGLVLLKRLLLRMVGPSGQLSLGLTGNIASGKSTVAAIWAEAGIPVLDADELAREVVRPGSPGLEAVVSEFGHGILRQDGSLDRAALSDLIFSDDESRLRLEGILHPRIWVLRDRWMRKHAAAQSSLTACEVPLLFEAGLEGDFDVSVFVDGSEETRFARLRDERGLAEEHARRIMAAQMDPSDKRMRASYVLQNEDGLQELEEEALDLLARVRREVVPRKDPAPGRLRIDMHMHTRTSFDCLSDPKLVLAAARARGVQRIAITDHDRLDGALALAADFPDSIIPGEEVKTAEGVDVIGLYLEEVIPRGTPAREVCRRIREQGGLVYLPHPYARGKGASGRYAEELAPLLDIVEVFNGRLHPGNLNEPAEELAARWSKARGAGSDAHTVGEVAGAYVEVEEHANEPKALLAALEGARVRGTTTPWSVHLASTWAKIHKRLPGGSGELR